MNVGEKDWIMAYFGILAFLLCSLLQHITDCKMVKK